MLACNPLAAMTTGLVGTGLTKALGPASAGTEAATATELAADGPLLVTVIVSSSDATPDVGSLATFSAAVICTSADAGDGVGGGGGRQQQLAI